MEMLVMVAVIVMVAGPQGENNISTKDLQECRTVRASYTHVQMCNSKDVLAD